MWIQDRLDDLSRASNDELLSSLETLVGEERRITAKVIAYLAEIEERRLHLDLAHPSLFDFCRRRLGLSEAAAARRVNAARLVQRFPRLLDAVADGRIHLSGLLLLRDVLSEENVDTLVEAACGKSKREIEEIVARLAPRADAPSTIRKLPASRLEPLSESRYRVELTVSAEVKDKIEHALALTSHQTPSRDLAPVLERALDLLIAKLEKTKLGKTDRPRARRAPRTPPTSGLTTTSFAGSEPDSSSAGSSPAGSSPARSTPPGSKPAGWLGANPAYVTRAARREVAARDGLRCSFVSADGERCTATHLLEIDHRHPRALGGTGEASNTRMLCRSHNRHAAERVFGRAHVEERIRLRQRSSWEDAEAGARETVHGALVTMGFRAPEARRALAAIDPASWDRPLEALVREALGVLT